MKKTRKYMKLIHGLISTQKIQHSDLLQCKIYSTNIYTTVFSTASISWQMLNTMSLGLKFSFLFSNQCSRICSLWNFLEWNFPTLSSSTLIFFFTANIKTMIISYCGIINRNACPSLRQNLRWFLLLYCKFSTITFISNTYE